MSLRGTLSILLCLLLVWQPGFVPEARAQSRAAAPEAAPNLWRPSRTAADLDVSARTLGAIVRDAAAIVDESERRLARGDSAAEELSLLKGQADQLDAVDREFQAAFAGIRSKLAEAGLGSRLPRLEDFIGNYNRKIGELRGQFHALSSDPKTRTLSRLRAARSSLASPLEVEPEDLRSEVRGGERPRRARVMLAPPAESDKGVAPRRADEDVPTAAHLAASKTVLLTPDIRSQASALGNDALRIYDFVHNNFAFAPYYGAMQNSQAVLVSGRGNDTDQATLLIALLRAANVPARYVSGAIRVSHAAAMNWVGARTPEAAFRIVQLFAGAANEESSIRLFHDWVEAYLETAEGLRWVKFDPSFKRHNYGSPVKIPLLPFDRDQYFGAPVTELATTRYLNQARDYLRQNHPGKGLSDAAYTGVIIPEQTSAAPSALQNQILTSTEQRPSAELNPLLHHRVRATITSTHADAAQRVTYLNVLLSLAEISHQSLTVGWGGATPADQRLIDLYGGLAGSLTILVDIVPQLRLDGRAIASGSRPLGVGTFVRGSIGYLYPFEEKDEDLGINSDTRFRGGESLAWALNANQYSERYFTTRQNAILNRTPALDLADPEPVVREMLHLAATRYLSRLALEKQRQADPFQLRYLLTGVEEAATRASVRFTKLFDRPFLITPSTLVLDADGLDTFFVDLNAVDTRGDEYTGFRRSFGLTGSSLEHELWEEFALVAGISTTKALQTSRQMNIPIRTIDKGNVDSELAALQTLQSYKDDMRGDVADGNIIITPQREATFQDWKGLGWITEGPGHRSFGYLIGRTNGGESIADPSRTTPPLDPTGVLYPGGADGGGCHDPVAIHNGDLYHQFDDFVIPTRGAPIRITRTYHSRSTYSGPVGYGWTHSYNLFLRETTAGVVFTDGTGGAFTFAPRGTGYASPAGLFLTLTKDAQGFLMRQKNGTELRFDTAGKLLTITDRNGNVQRLTYNGAGALIQIADPLNRNIAFAYNAQGRVISITDFTSRRVTFEYDVRANMTASADPAGNRTTYEYYSSAFNDHNLKTLTHPEGNKVSWEYYANDKVSKNTLAGGGEGRFFYLPLRNETVVLDERGFATTFNYNALGSITRYTRPNGDVQEFVFNAERLLTSHTDEAGFVTRYEYDANGNLTKATDALGGVTQLTYEATFNQPLTLRDPRGNTTRFEYDAKGNRTKTVDALGNETRLTFDSAGNPLTLTDAEGGVRTLVYDAQSNLTEIRDALGGVVKRQVDNLRRTTSIADPLNNETKFTYDTLGRTTAATNPAGDRTTLAYDKNSRVTERTDENGKASRFEYTPLGDLASVRDAAGASTRYGYNATDCTCQSIPLLTELLDGRGSAYRYSYDANGRLAVVRDPLGFGRQYTYDARGNLASKTDGNGATVRFEYDGLGRLVRKVFPDDTEHRFTYDANGNLTEAFSPALTLTFTYNAANRLLTANDPRLGAPTRYAYDKAGRVTGVTDPAGGVTAYAYDRNGNLTSIANPKGETTRFTYDAAGRRTRVERANGVRSDYVYDALGRLTSLANGALNTYRHTYDKAGNPLTITDASGAAAYQYDDLYRLTGATHPVNPAESYTYDAAGNRTSSGGDAYSYDAANRLLSAGAVSFTYNNNGAAITRTDAAGTTKYSYTFEGQLAQVERPDGTIARYTYDALGRRISREVGETATRYLYDREDILFELDGANQPVARYTHGPGIDEPLVMERGGASYFYLFDGQGSVGALADAGGAATQSYTYDSFGRILAASNATLVNPYAYRGREFDGESGLYHFRARAYDPGIGRFLSQDPLDLSGLLLTGKQNQTLAALAPIDTQRILEGPAAGASLRGLLERNLRQTQLLNQYTYASGRPLVLTDPTGLCSPPTRYLGDLSDQTIDAIGQIAAAIALLLFPGAFLADSNRSGDHDPSSAAVFAALYIILTAMGIATDSYDRPATGPTSYPVPSVIPPPFQGDT